MSDSVQPSRQQPARLLRPWDSPGKNTGVGCHFLLQCVKVKSESEVAQSCPTLSDPMGWSLPGSSVHGIFQARVLEWGAIAFCHFPLSFSPSQYIDKKVSFCLSHLFWKKVEILIVQQLILILCRNRRLGTSITSVAMSPCVRMSVDHWLSLCWFLSS